MQCTSTTLGFVLLHIYGFDLGATIYLPDIKRYQSTTPVLVVTLTYEEIGNDRKWHDHCLNLGFPNWLNVAVVSDTCDDATTQSEECLVAAFNDDCKAGGWLSKMMNYYEED